MTILHRDDGVDLYYEVHGTGPVVLLTHGFSSTSQMWRGQVEELSRDHTLVLWDMRGHGRTVSPSDDALYSRTATVGDMAALLDEVGVDAAVVGGLSLGGYMSLAFHHAHPERVRALLIIDTGPGFKNTAARAAWNDNAESTALELEKDGLAALRSRSPERAAAEHPAAENGGAEGLVRAARNMLTQHDASVIESLPHIAVPSLVLVGAEDTPFLAATEYMARKIAKASKVVLANAGHAANIDQPAAFNQAVRAFLDDNKL